MPASGGELPRSGTPTSGDAINLSPTSAPITSRLSDLWEVYEHAGQPGFSFEYPKLYGTTQYAHCQITIVPDDSYLLYLRFGNRSEFEIVNNPLTSFEGFVDNQAEGKTIDNKKTLSINGRDAITVEYRFGGLNRFGTSTYISDNDLIYIFNLTAGDFCNLPEVRLDELSTYNHAVERFKINP